MVKKKKVTKVVRKVVVPVEEVKLPTEKEQLLKRQTELLDHLAWLDINKYQDNGQVEVALSKVNQRLTEI